LSVSYNPSIVTSGLILCLDAANPKSYSGTGTAWSDLSGYANNATLVNSPTYLASYKGRFTFNGTNQYASTPLSLGGYTAFTIAAWFRTTTGSKDIAATYGVTNMFEFYINANGTVSIYAYGSTTSYRTSTTVVTAGAWTYCVATFNGATPALNMYINGALDNGALTNAIQASINAGSSTVVLGNVHSGSYYFNGSMGQISIYNRALTATEVTQNYNATKGRYVDPVIVTSGLVLNLDAANPQSYAGTGTTWTDLSGNSNNGTLTSGPTFDVAGGRNISFNGFTNYVAGTNTSSLQLTGDLTVAAWVKLGNNSSQGIFEKMYYAPYNGYGITKQDGLFKFWTASASVWAYTVSNTTYVADSRWYYVTGVRTSGVNRLFVNAVLQTDSQSPPLANSGDIYVIGRYYSNVNGYYLGGNISSVTAYNRALSAAEVTQNFSALRGRYGI